MIARRGIIAVRVTYYADNGQTLAHVSWRDGSRTSGAPDGLHMRALVARANREGINVTRDTWGAP